MLLFVLGLRLVIFKKTLDAHIILPHITLWFQFVGQFLLLGCSISSKIIPKFLLAGAINLSKNTLVVYCIQWIIIANATILVDGYCPELELEQY